MSVPMKSVDRLSEQEIAEVVTARAAARARFAQSPDDESKPSVVFDPDNPPMTEADLTRLRPAAEMVPALVAASLRRKRRYPQPTQPAAEQSINASAGDVMQIVEESLQIGKREVSHGRLRVRSYVVETPVNEQVSLRTESVHVDRRPVDRVVSTMDALFQDRVIEVEEFAEEAVVSKQARVVEEISLHKEARDRTETITDTVRRTEVDIEDGRGTVTRSGIVEGSNTGTVMAHMDVIASDGTKVGTVDHMDGADTIKLAKNTSPDGEHHYIPMAWVDHVDQQVHLGRSAAEIKADWHAPPE